MKMLLAGLLLSLLSPSINAGSAAPLDGLIILAIGESHMSIDGQLISTLPEALALQGAKVFSYGACGATPSAWLKDKSALCGAIRINTEPVKFRPRDVARTHPIGDLIAKHQANLVILVIGDTMGSYDQKNMLKTWIWNEVSSLTKEIKSHATRCIWVGPAWGKEGGKYIKTNVRAKELSDYLSTIVSPCIYIDSLTYSKIDEWGTIDGQHLTKSGYEEWARGITRTILSPAILSTIKP